MGEHHIGGQAVIEGVMMRARDHWVVAVRRPDGAIASAGRALSSVSERFPILKRPPLRGVISLIETLVLGVKALAFSANQNLGEDEEFSTREIVLTMALAVVLTVVIFIVIPFYLVRAAQVFAGNRILFTLVEGMIKILLFVGYLFIISRIGDFKRIFQYHGAEHKSINALEAGEPLTVENTAKYSTVHLRCGTTFMLVVLVLAIMVFSFLPIQSLIPRLVGKLFLIPIVSGVSYEIIKAAASKQRAWLRWLVFPGLWLQKLTTKEPTVDQLEVALVALKEVLAAEGGQRDGQKEDVSGENKRD